MMFTARKLAYWRLVAIAIFLTFGLWMKPTQAQPLPPAPVQPTGADTGPTVRFNWRVYVAFPNNQLRVEWIMTKFEALLKPKDVVFLDISDQCQLVGTPKSIIITNKIAMFKGGHYECQLPLFANEVQKYTGGGEYKCQCNYQLATLPFAGARFSVLPPPLKNYTLPLATIDKLRLSTNGVQTSLSLDQQAFLSNQSLDSSPSNLLSTFIGLKAQPFLNQLANYQGRDAFLNYPALINAAKNPNADVIAWLQGGAPVIGPLPPNLKFELDPNAIKFYIGYDPQSGTSFNGWLSDLVDDPGCQGSK